MEIDERMITSFDKLYPDNFRLLVSPELFEGVGSVERDRNRMFATRANVEFSNTYRNGFVFVFRSTTSG